MYRGFRRHLPPITNRLAFIRGRSLSPDDAPILITNRMAFTTRYEGDEPGDALRGKQDAENHAVAAGPTDHKDVLEPVAMDVDGGESSSEESGSEDECEGLSDSEVQPCNRPRGTLSKPSDNGYSLGVVLGWSTRRYRIVQNNLRPIARDELNCRVLIKAQNKEALATYVERAVKRFPFLAKYPGGWPAEDFAAIYLKNCVLKIQNALKNKRKGLAKRKGKGKEKGKEKEKGKGRLEIG
ncbi:hypothetical protein BDN72DRAFT_865721 [Pluteus cervinus]|uniref:Uncharacterized protein n=1 Tax=Pluteus cervinus TaxID=181527 RepID=A0ACD2ZZ83_9AGAR|nr:hypothetical protein BDN72DRAFT_865721 [Pluteus cervinus]